MGKIDVIKRAAALGLSARLRNVIGRLVRSFREEIEPGQLNWSQLSVLTRLEIGPSTVTALARAEGMRPQSMSVMIADLEAAGFVSGAPDPSDGRCTILSLTNACRDVLVAKRAAREDWLTRIIDKNLTPDERKQLAAAVEILEKLAGN